MTNRELIKALSSLPPDKDVEIVTGAHLPFNVVGVSHVGSAVVLEAQKVAPFTERWATSTHAMRYRSWQPVGGKD